MGARQAACPQRPPGGQGLRRDLRALDDGARHRGKGRRQSRLSPRRSANASAPSSATRSRNLKAGSAEAAKVKAALIEEGVWSQYLEVGIGPDAEVFSKAPAAVVGRLRRRCRPASDFELEQSRAGNRAGRDIRAATSRARRSATTSTCATSRAVRRCCSARRRTTTPPARSAPSSACSTRPIRSTMSATPISISRSRARTASSSTGTSSMKEISRDPLDLVGQTIGRHHQYPDGFMLFMGTLFAPVEDRDTQGPGFHPQDRRQGDDLERRARQPDQRRAAVDGVRALDIRHARADGQPGGARASLTVTINHTKFVRPIAWWKS